MRNKLTSLFITVAGLLGSALPGHAATTSDYTLYTPEAWVIGVSGDTAPLLDATGGRYVENPISLDYMLPLPESRDLSATQIQNAEEALHRTGAARDVLNWLLCYDSAAGTISDARLLERAALNRRLSGQPDVPETELKKELVPLLTHNYIYLERKIYFDAPAGQQIDSTRNYYKVYALFAIEAPESALAEAVRQRDVALYLQVPVSVKCVKSGHVGTHTDIATQLTKSVPALAQSAVVVSSSPQAQIAAGKTNGFANGDLVSLYRTATDEKGLPQSKRVGYARLTGVSDNKAGFDPITLGTRHVDSGTMAVHRGNKNISARAGATWMKGMWGGEIGFGFRLSTNSHGYTWKLLVDGGYAACGSGENSTDRFISNVNGNVGVGIAKTFGGFVELMPSVQVGYSYIHTSLKASGLTDKNGNFLRFPIGLTAGFNVCYPLQILLSAGYVPTVGFEFDGAQSPTEDYKKVKEICKARNVSIDGFFLKLGLQYNF